MADKDFKENMGSKTDDRQIDSEVQNKNFGLVLSNKVLLKMILRFALYDTDYQVDKEELQNLRLLTQSSKEAVQKILEKAKDPLYTVTMNAPNSLARKRKGDGRVNKSILNKFSSFLKTSTAPGDYKGFCLIMEDTVFRSEVYGHFVSCLAEIGNNLVELDLTVPDNGGSFPGLLPNSLKFPTLQKLTVKFTGIKLKALPTTEQLPNPAGNEAFLLHSLLLKSEKLVILHIEGHIPVELQYMHMPETLTSIHLEIQENPKVLECLVSNRFINLKKLQILHCFYDETTIPKDLPNRILRACQKIKDLVIQEYINDKPPRNQKVQLQFPVMENLQRLTLSGVHTQLKHIMMSLSTVFPKLTTLNLRRQTVDMFLKWVASTTVTSVTCLDLELVDGQKQDYEETDDFKYYNTLSIPLEVMERVNMVFPNITKLCLFHYGTEYLGLQYIFREMREIKSLRIIAGATDPHTHFSSDHYDSLLTGVPLELVIALGACSNFCKKVKLDNDSEISIKLLKELEYLRLEAPVYAGVNSIISDFSFKYALNKMKKLKHVCLLGNYTPSKEIVNTWKEQNRKLEVFLN